MSSPVMFEDIFVVDKLDPDGKKFDKVCRIEARSQKFEMFMHLDVNTEIYPMSVNDKFTLALSPTLNLDGTPDTGYFTQGGRKSLADRYEYVMHGKLYKISEDTGGKSSKDNGGKSAKGSTKGEMCVSYGGLLMFLSGDYSYISNFELDQRLFLLIRKL